MFAVKYFGVKVEAKLIKSFIEWQGKPCSVENDPSTLNISRGHGAAILFKDDEIVAKGFFEAVEYWKKNGLTLC